MALEDIFKALEEQGDREIDEMLAAARTQADAIAEEAAEEAAQLRRQRVEQAERSARVASAQRLNAARLESKKRLAAMKEAAVHDSFEEAMKRLSDVRSGSGYKQLFQALAQEALAGVGQGAVVRVDPADEPLARESLASMGASAEVRGDLRTAGGLVVELDGGRIVRRNTLEDRLAKLRGTGQADVAEILFS